MKKFEHKAGDRVGIVRHRHGWEDGRIEGTVTEVMHRSGGAAHYTVKDDNGYEYEIHKTTDLISLE